MNDRYNLYHNGNFLASHSSYLATWTEAKERGLVKTYRGEEWLADNVEIKKEKPDV